MGLKVGDYVEELGETLGEALLRPTRIYTKACKALAKEITAAGIIHITGGGFFENIPRIIPEGLGVKIDTGAWQVPKVFNYIAECAQIEKNDMFSTFNMGIGMMFIVDPAEKDRAMELLKEAGETPALIGEIVKGEGVILC